MIRLSEVLVFFFAWVMVNGQISDTATQEVSPRGGVNQLAVEYYGIDFTEEQRERLRDKEIEFIFQIDALGVPTLSEVNGISDSEIVDSLKNRTLLLDNFKPRIRNGTAEPSIYFMKLQFPTYRMTQSRLGMLQGIEYREASLSDFEIIRKSKSRLDMMIGGVANQFCGEPSEHLAFGGGMKVDISLSDKKQFIYGLNMSFYGNKLKKEYPLNISRTQLSGPPTLLAGAIFGRLFNGFIVQTEVNMAIQNVTEKMGDNDPDWTQLKGWSPGITLSYPIQLGVEKPTYYYGAPTLFSNHLNVYLGIRYLSLSLKEASGIMIKAGVGYRMVVEGVKEYKFKDEFMQ